MNPLLKLDQKNVWHPYSPHYKNFYNKIVIKAKGPFLYLEDGSKIVDAISSWWVNLHGHNHPQIIKAINKQFRQIDHVLFSSYTHKPAIELSSQLSNLVSKNDQSDHKVFFSDNGSTAVETALKISYQYFINDNRPRSRFVALEGGFHGDTLGAMSVSHRSSFNHHFKNLLFPVDYIKPNDFQSLENYFVRHGHDCVAFIFEPLIQGAYGMNIYSQEFLNQILTLCSKYGVISVADEIFTGLYRTGKFLACHYINLRPDIVCLSKGITGGVMPFGATIVKNRIFKNFSSAHISNHFLHGHSFNANPLACAASLASLDILKSIECQEKIKMISHEMKNFVEDLKQNKKICNPRSLGTILAFNLLNNDSYGSKSSLRVVNLAFRRKLLLRPLGSVLYICPPYCLTKRQLSSIFNNLKGLIDEI